MCVCVCVYEAGSQWQGRFRTCASGAEWPIHHTHMVSCSVGDRERGEEQRHYNGAGGINACG